MEQRSKAFPNLAQFFEFAVVLSELPRLAVARAALSVYHVCAATLRVVSVTR